MNTDKVEILDFHVGGEYSDFVDSYILEATYEGKPMTHGEIEQLENEHSEWVYKQLINYIV